MERKTRAILGTVFFTCFLDVVGFSLIFPLFPHLLRYYLAQDGDSFLLKAFLEIPWSSGGNTPVLFGGILGALYSFLQFLAAPLWGRVSDRVGRRPILLLSTFSLAISYLLWAFASSFDLLVLSRILGGFMGGNISVATAAIADVTNQENRSRGMALVGMAFALGLVLGPALGGALSFLRLDLFFEIPGLNPFSGVALLGLVLGVGNFFLVLWKFQETKPGGHPTNPNQRSINPLVFWELPDNASRRIVVAHFLFVVSFSGMEFTLAFLAYDRFAFGPRDNALAFVFMGLVLALVQGGWVRRKARAVGEVFLVRRGILVTIAGLVLTGQATHVGTFYGGLFLLSVGAAFVIPCLTALLSLQVSPENQGKAMGIFRSIGALGRILGPLLASLLYWGWSESLPYYVGAGLLLVTLRGDFSLLSRDRRGGRPLAKGGKAVG